MFIEKKGGSICFKQAVITEQSWGQRYQNGGTICRFNVWQNLPTFKSQRMPSVPVHTLGSCDWQLSTYTGCINTTHKKSNATKQDMGELSEFNRATRWYNWMGAGISMQLVRWILCGRHYRKHHKHTNNLNTASVRMVVQIPLVPVSHMHYHARNCVSAEDIVNESLCRRSMRNN